MRFIARLISGAATIILVAALLAFGALATAIVSGLKPAVVKTGSMRPLLRPGTLILVKPTPASQLRIGDVITFTHPDKPSKGLVTHRIVKIQRENGQLVFRTQGDANDAPDTWRLKLRKDAGRLKFHVHEVGRLSFLVRTKQGYLALLGIPVLILSLIALMKIWRTPEAADDTGGNVAPAADSGTVASPNPATQPNVVELSGRDPDQGQVADTHGRFPYEIYDAPPGRSRESGRV